MRTLIVEDDPTCRLILERSLASLGEMQTAADGATAVAVFRDALNAGYPIDLMCLDIMLPELNGQDVLKQIREMEDIYGLHPAKRAIVIMTTSQDDKENLLKAVPHCDAYLTKPINLADLMFYIKKFGLPQSRLYNTPPSTDNQGQKPWGDKEREMPWVG
jgi:two-component system, chemotaxis family, chemotaxis protein CheY